MEDITIRFDLGSFPKKNKASYGDYAFFLMFKGLDLTRLEGAHLICGDSEGTLNGVEEIFYAGFECKDPNQIEYLEEHFAELLETYDVMIDVVYNARSYHEEPLIKMAKVANGKFIDPWNEEESYSINEVYRRANK